MATSKIRAQSIATGAISSSVIADGGIDSDAIGSAAIGTAKLQDDAVQTDKIQDGAIHTAKLNDSAVHTAKIQDGAVTSAKLNGSAVQTDKIQDGAVTSAKIDPAKVTQWDSAYGWGDHALAGYADSAGVQSQIDAIAVTPTQVSDQDNTSTGHFVTPKGTTGERPTGADLYTGGIRYNSTLVTWEGYNGTQWTGLGGGNPWVTITDSDSPYSIAANDRVFVDTSNAAVTITLPSSPLTGDQIRAIDLASTFDTNNCTIARNGKKINGADSDLTLSTEDIAIGLVFSGDTHGWKLIEVL